MLKQGEGLRDTKAEAKVTGREAESKPYAARHNPMQRDVTLCGVMQPYAVRPYAGE